uniref:Uncharacterized protein n=1 Tax=Arundo donax TaxID=35708 RepID=A0A0A8Z0B0_ARUDO
MVFFHMHCEYGLLARLVQRLLHCISPP